MTDFRALCAELAAWLHAYALRAPLDIGSKDEAEHDLACSLNQLLARARAALSAPEQGPKDDAELRTVYAIGSEARWREGFPEEWSLTDMERAAQSAGLLAVLARWGRPAVEPVPVAERLPGPEDCDAEGRCWWLDRPLKNGPAAWMLRRPDDGVLIPFIAWAPHWALPVPQEGSDG